jgi:hypothetical protein
MREDLWRSGPPRNWKMGRILRTGDGDESGG